MPGKPEATCQRCGGSGCEPTPHSKGGPTSQQKKLLNQHAFNRHEVLKLLDRFIATHVVMIESELADPDGARMTDILEETGIYLDRVGEALAKADEQVALRCLFHVATNAVYILESFEFGPHHLHRDGDGDE